MYMFGVSMNLINYFIQQGCIQMIKCDIKDIYNGQNNLISNKCCSVELSIHHRILEKKIIARLFSTLIIRKQQISILIVKMAPRMAAVLRAPGKLCSFSYVLFVFLLFYVLDVVSITVYDRDTLLNIGSSVAQRKPDFEFPYRAVTRHHGDFSVMGTSSLQPFLKSYWLTPVK